jgi:hypothetical protein
MLVLVLDVGVGVGCWSWLFGVWCLVLNVWMFKCRWMLDVQMPLDVGCSNAVGVAPPPPYNVLVIESCAEYLDKQ